MSCTTVNIVEQVFTIDITDCGIVIDELDGFNVYDEGVYKGIARSIDFVGDNVSVEIQGTRAVVTVTGGGSSGGGSSLIDHPISSGAPSGTITKGTRYYLVGTADTILGELVSEGTVMEARIDNPSTRGGWYFNFGGT